MHYIVKLNIQTGKFQNRTTKLIEAANAEEAETTAIEGDGHYSVADIQAVSMVDLPSLKRYL